MAAEAREETEGQAMKRKKLVSRGPLSDGPESGVYIHNTSVRVKTVIHPWVQYVSPFASLYIARVTVMKMYELKKAKP